MNSIQTSHVNQQNPAIVYLIPLPIVENEVATLPEKNIEYIKSCSDFFVENIKTARRFVKACDRNFVIDHYAWHVMDKNETTIHTTAFTKCLQAGKVIGIMSESGCPGIADPGQTLVQIAHQHEIDIKPLVGPSSILLALMASGMNGQNFTFNGYLPIEKIPLIQKIKALEQTAKQKKSTQVFIETPYRNAALFLQLIENLHPNSLLLVAQNITATDAFIQTKKIYEWKQKQQTLKKEPTVFAIYAE